MVEQEAFRGAGLQAGQVFCDLAKCEPKAVLPSHVSLGSPYQTFILGKKSEKYARWWNAAT